MDPQLAKAIAHEYEKDPEVKKIFQKRQETFSKEKQLFNFKGRIFIPQESFGRDLLHDYHTVTITGHLGARKTYLRIRPHYYWKGL